MNIMNFDSGCSNRMTVPVEEQFKMGWLDMDGCENVLRFDRRSAGRGVEENAQPR